MNLAKKLRPGTLPAFDYAALNDPAVEQRARAAVLKIRELQKAAVVDIGQELLAMKALLPHGQFLPWVESFGLERRTATNYMQVAAEFGAEWATVSHLPTGIIYKLAAPSTPPAVREAVMHMGPNQIVSMGNVQEMIDAVKTSERRKDKIARREQIQQDQAAHRARWEARDARERVEREKRQEEAQDVAEQVRSMLGDRFPDVCALLKGVDLSLFADQFGRLVSAYEARL